MKTQAINFQHFDASINPADDLFGHVNGGWAATAEIPGDRSSWGAFHELREASEEAIGAIIESLDPQANADNARIAALYRSFMDTDTIEALGTKPLQDLLARVDEITAAGDLAEFWGWCSRFGFGGLFAVDNDADPGDPTRYLIFFGQSGISLGDEEYYRLDQHAEIREKYREHMETMFTLAGVADASAQAAAAFELETQIAACHWDKIRTRDLVEMYHPQSWEEFTQTAPTLEWDRFIDGAKLPREVLATVINSQRTFATDVAALVTEERLDDWRAWARWQLIDGLASVLDEKMVEQNFDFYGRTLNGIPHKRERSKRGISLVESYLGEAVGRLYVAEHFPPEVKHQADELVQNLLEAYRRSITTLEWMTDDTRAEALDKLAKFNPKIGYPNKWRDYSGLEFVDDDLVGNVLRGNSFEFDYMISQLSGPVDTDEWMMFPQTVNAYYHPLRNEIVFPAAILQPPFFNADADDAVNYGAIGAVIGHEIGHGFDDQGSTCDGDGRIRNWWTDADRAAFEARTKNLVEQYDVLSPAAAPDVTVNGELTLGENIGDLGGLAIAYDAWKIATEGHELESIDGYTPAQRFFIGWAQTWRTITRPEAMRERIATDPHSPDEIRCNQTPRNLDEFHEAFATSTQDEMWMNPEERIRIW